MQIHEHITPDLALTVTFPCDVGVGQVIEEAEPVYRIEALAPEPWGEAGRRSLNVNHHDVPRMIDVLLAAYTAVHSVQPLWQVIPDPAHPLSGKRTQVSSNHADAPSGRYVRGQRLLRWLLSGAALAGAAVLYAIIK